MVQHVGVTPFSALTSSEAKKLALLFDRLCIPGLNEPPEWLRSPSYFRTERNATGLDLLPVEEMDWLREQGFVDEAVLFLTADAASALLAVENLTDQYPNYFTRMVAEHLRSSYGIDSVAIEPNRSLHRRRFAISPAFYHDWLRVTARCEPYSRRGRHTPFLAEPNNEGMVRWGPATPSHPSRYVLKTTPLDEPAMGHVIHVVLQQFPEPDPLTSWERLFAFRRSPVAMRQLLCFRQWLKKWKPGMKPTEVAQELEYLLSEYQHHMHVHGIQVKKGVLETVVVSTAEFVEDFIKLKWSKIARSLFSVHGTKAVLMKEELKAPGREVAYILSASNVLRGRT